ncbi:hypothetical protein HPB50_005155 [Hyalomma asiaticum]|uniref:Uncharacterized protein n=1 Tax=Hyalomma asiaticum TaxID=266040 RepID=A0ACB7S6Y9_HYAAI|nr:hypothetical protein HPB50_005155 [Hyalomma asiaticum]
MEPQRGVMVSSAAFVILSLVSMSSAMAIFGCPPVDDRNANATLIANPHNCSTFYLCQQGIPVLMECPKNLQFNDALKVCDYADRANCVPLLPTLPPVPPEPTEAATEKIVIKKIVKEVIRPVTEGDAPVTDHVEEAKTSESEVPASVGSGDATEAAIVDADVNADVGSVVQPLAGTVTEAVEQGILGSVADDVGDTLGVL